MNRQVTLPHPIKRVICSGAGCLRYLTYLQSLDRVIAVDELETRRSRTEARPYAIAHPELRRLPVFGELRGQDNPELIAALDPAPDLIFKTFNQMGSDPSELQTKTGIPVFVVEYGDLTNSRSALYATLRIMGKILQKGERAEEIVTYIDRAIADLERRTRNMSATKTAYVGGIAHQGPLGLQSSEPNYPPFVFTNTRNLTFAPNQRHLRHIDVAKERIVAQDPDVIFIDLATLGGEPQANAWHELKTDSAYASLRAVKSREIYGVLPYNGYAQNYGSTLADAYFIGKVLYPDRFSDIEPAKKADEIYAFLVGAPVFKALNESLGGMAFRRMQ